MIMAVNRRNKILSQKGQGLIEFLMFLPFMLMMYSVILTFSNAMNASINQQKVTRGYFYYRIQNNSMFPQPSRDSGGEPSDAWRYFGMEIMGWAESFEGGNNKPVAPCFKLRLPLGTADDDACEEAYGETTTQFIRVASVYGVCGATIENSNSQRIRHPMAGSAMLVISENACQITR